MLRGMTGFAQASCRFKDAQLNLEIRSLNHRYIECLVYCPDGFGLAEDLIKGLLKDRIKRGRLSATLSVSNLHPKVVVDYELAANYVKTLKQLNQRLKLENNISLSQVISLEGVLRTEKPKLTAEFIRALKSLANKAVSKLIAIRKQEGDAVTRDLLRCINIIKSEVEKISVSIRELSQKKKAVLSEDEYGVFLKSTDINEELSRLSYHTKNFLAVIKKESAAGKELDFIGQEIQREANTISAKAQSAQVSSSVVKIKSAIDQIREQVQNVE